MTLLRRLAVPIELSVLAGLVVFAMAVRLWNLDQYTGSFDEGIRCEQLFLMSTGLRPFRDIFSSQGVLLLDLLYPFFATFGQTLEAARIGVVAFSLVGLLGAWWVARQAAGHVAGLAAVSILVMSTGYHENSRFALAEVPTIAPALLSLGCMLRWSRSRAGGIWLALAAALFAIAMLTKPMVIHVAIPLGLIWLSKTATRRGEWRATAVRSALVFGGVLALIVAAPILAMGPREVWDNLGAYRGGAGHALGADALKNLRLTTIEMSYERAGIFVLAAIGVALGLLRATWPTLAVMGWAAGVLGLFVVYGDLSDKHIVYLVPPVALLAAIGCGITARLAWQSWRDWSRPTRRLSALDIAAAVIGLCGIVIYLSDVPPLYRAIRYANVNAEKVAESRRGFEIERELTAVIAERVPVDGWVLADMPNAACTARRRVIPSLVDTSGTRVDAGSLTSARAIDAVGAYRPEVIITHPRRLGRLDEFTAWIRVNGYQLDRTYPQGWRLYLRAS